MSSTAIWAPRLSCSPKAAFEPVIGPAEPILIWASAGVATSATAATARVPYNFLIPRLPYLI